MGQPDGMQDMARTLFLRNSLTAASLQQFDHIELPQQAAQCARLARAPQFRREQQKHFLLDFCQIDIMLLSQMKFFCQTNPAQIIGQPAARKGKGHSFMKTDCRTYHDSVQPSIEVSMFHDKHPSLTNQNHRFAF